MKKFSILFLLYLFAGCMKDNNPVLMYGKNAQETISPANLDNEKIYTDLLFNDSNKESITMKTSEIVTVFQGDRLYEYVSSCLMDILEKNLNDDYSKMIVENNKKIEKFIYSDNAYNSLETALSTLRSISIEEYSSCFDFVSNHNATQFQKSLIDKLSHLIKLNYYEKLVYNLDRIEREIPFGKVLSLPNMNLYLVIPKGQSKKLKKKNIRKFKIDEPLELTDIASDIALLIRNDSIFESNEVLQKSWEDVQESYITRYDTEHSENQPGDVANISIRYNENEGTIKIDSFRSNKKGMGSALLAFAIALIKQSYNVCNIYLSDTRSDDTYFFYEKFAFRRTKVNEKTFSNMVLDLNKVSYNNTTKSLCILKNI